MINPERVASYAGTALPLSKIALARPPIRGLDATPHYQPEVAVLQGLTNRLISKN
jgi:hypothetical protein